MKRKTYKDIDNANKVGLGERIMLGIVISLVSPKDMIKEVLKT